ncbi:ABC transporter permease subunit [Halomicrobium sp. LC1Hm]|uniref:ABC transporter permease subunit n=1 Tax=Halomicrobium sp. LC1Hm TaxID=2610902 RepID=UPI0012982C91|nr:ABC transporter permease subunit [Halomicrobium sp. LC1Hm]QGA83092.1 ABC-type Na+ efflux pump, permease component [Halomicrobium sp. LC1Hm]
MNPRKLLRIAKWEVTKNAGGVDKRTVAIMAVSVVAMVLVAGLAASSGASGLDSGLYRIGVDESSSYYAPASDDAAFVVQEPDPAAVERGDQELLFVGTQLASSPEDPKERAALGEFRTSVDRYNSRQMARDDNQTAAAPVSVTLVYLEQSGVSETIASDSGSGDGGDGDGGSAGGSSGASGGDGGSAGGSTDSDAGGLAGLGAGLTGGSTTGSPSDIQPPFPFESLVLAFLFIVPMNFVIQAYGSTMLSERLNRRGELLLVSPVSRFDIVAGKTLPYFLGAMGVVTAITLGLRFSGLTAGGGPIAVLAMLPIALLFLSATFCGAMFARSFKELTFVTVTVTVSLTSYAFVPAIFTDVTPIALISPLTVVVRDLQAQAVTLGDFVFATTPPTLTAVVLFGLGAGLYREEDMFTQRAIPLKVLDALSGRIKSKWSALKLSVILLPFVFVAELAAVALLFALGDISIPLVLVAVVVIEEVAKSLHLYAGFTSGRYDRSLRTGVVVGALSGVGFFLAEKVTVLAQLVNPGLREIPTSQAGLELVPAGVPLPLVLLVLLLLPLLLHVVTATVSSLGARRSRRSYLLALGAAMVIHFAYNYTVVIALGQ